MRSPVALTLAVVVCIVFPQTTRSAEREEEVSLRMLQAPASPAFVLLGVEPSSVERPGEVTDLGFSLLTATDELSVLPQNYAVSFAPYWLMGKGSKLTYEEWAGAERPFASIVQTLDISVAASKSTLTDSLLGTSEELTSLGLGVRVSILRGTILKDDEYTQAMNDLDAALNAASLSAATLLDSLQRADSLLTSLEGLLDESLPDESLLQVQAMIEARNAELVDQVDALLATGEESAYARIRSAVSNLKLRRVGWKLDLAGGVTGDYPGRNTADGRIGRAGAWLTGGYESKHVSLLVVGRMIQTNTINGPNSNSWDLGGRLTYDDNKKFSASIEALTRSTDDNAATDDTWRLAFSSDYTVGPNRTLSLTFGRDFEGRQTGNLIAAVHLLLGYGSTRGLM